MESRVLEMKPVSLSDVKQILKKSKTDKEPTYEQDQTMKFVGRFGKLTEKQTKDLTAGLKQIGPLKENEYLLYEIVNVVPTRIEQLKLMLPKNVPLTEEDMKAIIALTEKYADKVQ